MPDVTQLSHGRSSLLGTPMFRDTLCSAFLSVNTNFCSSSLLHLDGAVPPRYSGSGGETDFDGYPVVAVAAVAPCLASNLPLLGLSPCSSFGEASLSPCTEKGAQQHCPHPKCSGRGLTEPSFTLRPDSQTDGGTMSVSRKGAQRMRTRAPL